MLEEVNGLMERMGFDALVVYGESTASCPELAYFVRTAIPRGGIYLKKRGSEPLLVVSNLDIGCARKGMVSTVKTYGDYGLRELQRRYGPGRAFAQLLVSVLRDERVGGRVALAGRFDAFQAAFLIDYLRRMGFRVVGSPKPTLIDLCRRTKDQWEIDRIRDAGRKTVSVVRRFEKVLEEANVVNDKVVFEGAPLTSGRLRRLVKVWCAEEGLSLVEGFIIAVGPESADPHFVEEKDTPITSGTPILFDIYPADTTGYRYDFTRTYCIGRPRHPLRKMFEDILDAQQTALDTIEENIACEVPFVKVCRLLKARGWPTLLDREVKDRGFTHGLGHGVGLTIGEEPYLTRFNRSKLVSGDVVTVEPGLYEPGFGGARVEDVVLVEKDRCIVMTEHRKQLEF
ncbi:MAG: M24 family metallopeptidase [Candidatus Caldarchaeum sp.]|nr:M24 family metallopeptidase [Candidatus Caldarchaeum sp.]